MTSTARSKFTAFFVINERFFSVWRAVWWHWRLGALWWYKRAFPCGRLSKHGSLKDPSGYWFNLHLSFAQVAGMARRPHVSSALSTTPRTYSGSQHFLHLCLSLLLSWRQVGHLVEKENLWLFKINSPIKTITETFPFLAGVNLLKIITFFTVRAFDSPSSFWRGISTATPFRALPPSSLGTLRVSFSTPSVVGILAATASGFLRQCGVAAVGQTGSCAAWSGRFWRAFFGCSRFGTPSAPCLRGSRPPRRWSRSCSLVEIQISPRNSRTYNYAKQTSER